MTAPTTLPAEVQAIVADLTRRPSMLRHHTPAAVNAAFDHGLIEVIGNDIDTRTLIKYTLYALRGAR